MAGSTNASKTRELIKDMIMASLQENKIPWHKPWQGGEVAFEKVRNLVMGNLIVPLRLAAGD